MDNFCHFFLDVCALRFDFETFTTAGPTLTTDNSDCVDTFQVTSVSIINHVKLILNCLLKFPLFLKTPSGFTTPVICGENTGYHSKSISKWFSNCMNSRLQAKYCLLHNL